MPVNVPGWVKWTAGLRFQTIASLMRQIDIVTRLWGHFRPVRRYKRVVILYQKENTFFLNSFFSVMAKADNLQIYEKGLKTVVIYTSFMWKHSNEE